METSPKIALVTGAGSGIGRACALGLLVGSTACARTKTVTTGAVPPEYESALNRTPAKPGVGRPRLDESKFPSSDYVTVYGERIRLSSNGSISFDNIDCRHGGSVYLGKTQMRTLVVAWLATMRQQAEESVAVTTELATAARDVRLASNLNLEMTTHYASLARKQEETLKEDMKLALLLDSWVIDPNNP